MENGKAKAPGTEAAVVYNAREKILGRLASQVAKELLNGKNVSIINAEQAVITGDKETLKAKYTTRMRLIEKMNPEHSPYWPRRPDMLVRRIVRGMLPYRRPRGKDAYRRLRVFMGVPESLKSVKAIEINTRSPKELYVRSITVLELVKLLGYNDNMDSIKSNK
jgi:large subunit ribosomal protein L13